MNIQKALRANQSIRLAIVGSGGKSTTLFQLARQLPPPVIITTSTHIGAWQLTAVDRHLILRDGESVENYSDTIIQSGITAITGEVDGESRAQGLSTEKLLAIKDFADSRNIPLLIEADGSRQKPLKAPASHEPAIPLWVNCVVVTVGLSGLQKTLDEQSVHRPQLFAAISGLDAHEIIGPQAVERYLIHPAGGLKNIPPEARRIVLLNQVDTEHIRQEAEGMAGGLLDHYDAVLLASLNRSDEGNSVLAVYEPAAGIVLAAGSASRYGQPKVLLDWKGKPLVRQVAQTALIAGLSPVVVVAGEHFEHISAALSGLPVKLTKNIDWADGQSSSLQKGLDAIGSKPGSAIFLLADQPFVTAEVIRKLRKVHSETLSLIVAPVVAGRRANPVLFDRSTFRELLKLTGDTGGRALFQHFGVTDVEHPDQSLLLDIDTEEDFRRLQQMAGGEE